MISIFKNFHVRPAHLSVEKTKNLLRDVISKYDDGKRDVQDYIPVDASKVFNHKEIRLELSRYYHEKCAYCEQKSIVMVDLVAQSWLTTQRNIHFTS